MRTHKGSVPDGIEFESQEEVALFGLQRDPGEWLRLARRLGLAKRRRGSLAVR